MSEAGLSLVAGECGEALALCRRAPVSATEHFYTHLGHTSNRSRLRSRVLRKLGSGPLTQTDIEMNLRIEK